MRDIINKALCKDIPCRMHTKLIVAGNDITAKSRKQKTHAQNREKEAPQLTASWNSGIAHAIIRVAHPLRRQRQFSGQVQGWYVRT